MKSLQPIFLMLCLSFLLAPACSQVKPSQETNLRAQIKLKLEKAIEECTQDISVVSDLNDRTEFWQICELDQKRRLIKIESYTDGILYQEIYFEAENDLIYAKETEQMMPKNHFAQSIWNCEYFTQNGEVLSTMSLGHGKTESEDWQAESIFELYQQRLKELKSFKN
ncbi:hypothetical protein NMK71_06960 [Weeksellaceae bacterium KMM 9713]|uniref:Lipoprotein n=1 Tax=Profundicola chukchiensis TaxID=2961959 RepID=A0A9X4MYX7_9FLAO|nr:hypothetical protein [Profundicola chukchiensis]MDG4946150.1 hypothetical protein [Profundicola chukchiensis]